MEQSIATPFESPANVIAWAPMRNVVLFLHVLMPITVVRTRSIATIVLKSAQAILTRVKTRASDCECSGLGVQRYRCAFARSSRH